jgi:hypothetical protein
LAPPDRDFEDIGDAGGASPLANVEMAAGQSIGANDRCGNWMSCAAPPALMRASIKPGINPTALTGRSHEEPFPESKVPDKGGSRRALLLSNHKKLRRPKGAAR